MAEFKDIFMGGDQLEGAELEAALDGAYGIRSRAETPPTSHKGRTLTDVAGLAITSSHTDAGFCDVAPS